MKSVNKIWLSNLWWIFLLILIIAVNFLASVFHSRLDLTKEKRYTLSKASKQLLSNLDEPVMIDVFVHKESLPSEVKKLENSIHEFLLNCKEYGKSNFQFRFFNPYLGLPDSSQTRMEDSLNYFYGIYPSILDAPEKVGDKLEISKLIHGAVVKYRDTTIGVNLLQGLKGFGTEREQRAALYNNVEATLEYKFMHAIEKVVAEKKPIIGYALGHGEAFGYNINDAFLTLRSSYNADTINIRQIPFIPPQLDALVILKPTLRFSESDKLKIDQYIMRGGKIFWMIDVMYAEFDSLYKSDGFVAFDRGLNLDDLLFRYGARINQNLLQDMQCDQLGQMSGNQDNPQQRLVNWPFFPVLNGTDHPISKNLDGVRAMFPNTVDTVKAQGIKKTFLLKSSSNARVLSTPAKVDFEFLQIAPEAKFFTVRDTSVAILLEGKFQSFYDGRISKSMADSLISYGIPFINKSEKDGKMIVVADGDIATNQVSPQDGPLPMGYNFFTRHTFANKDFFLNSLEYLVNPSDILKTRAKDYTLRLLDPVKTKDQKTRWQIINIAAPILLIILFGFIYQQIRKRKYSV
ncbi:MAG TPA: gliding motility-associated ABC transporter substrate-binding protein GldG [Chitinophagaceae bacterium]|nr:gliding motility-associated ABC transporter substrate-binding protein GldG [Chitinophagaceae bacterium]